MLFDVKYSEHDKKNKTGFQKVRNFVIATDIFKLFL